MKDGNTEEKNENCRFKIRELVVYDELKVYGDSPHNLWLTLNRYNYGGMATITRFKSVTLNIQR